MKIRLISKTTVGTGNDDGLDAVERLSGHGGRTTKTKEDKVRTRMDDIADLT